MLALARPKTIPFHPGIRAPAFFLSETAPMVISVFEWLIKTFGLKGSAAQLSSAILRLIGTLSFASGARF